MTARQDNSQTFWDEHYHRHPDLWSGAPNAVLVDETRELSPGSALDLGCGEGADAIWLARRGWQVTAVDISPIALGRAAERARAAGVTHRITCAQHDLDEGFPAGSFDLVAAHYLHSRQQRQHPRMLERAARAVAPGGSRLLVPATPRSLRGHGTRTPSSQPQPKSWAP